MRNEVIVPNFKEEEIQKFMYGYGFKKFLVSDTSKVKFFSGHVPYGIHRFIRQKCEYITFLRDPIDRAVSHYNFVKYSEGRNKNYDLHNQWSLAEIFDHTSALNPFKALLVDNMQTRCLAGLMYYALPKNSSLLLKRAKYNLEHKYRVFGYKEKYKESSAVIAREMGWQIGPPVAREKVTSQKDPIDAHTRQVLAENHKLDTELYAFAVELFEKRFG